MRIDIVQVVIIPGTSGTPKAGDFVTSLVVIPWLNHKTVLAFGFNWNRIDVSQPKLGIYRDNLSAIVIGDNLLSIIVIAQNNFDLSIIDIAFVIYFVIADKLSR